MVTSAFQPSPATADLPRTVGELRQRPLEELQANFGSFGQGLYNRARGVDERPVQPHQEVQQVSSEDTFAEDQPIEALAPEIARLAERTWQATRRTGRIGRTVVLKLKTSQFRILTRSLTPPRPPSSLEELVAIAQALVERVDLPPDTRYRLVGVGVGGFADIDDESMVQGQLFASGMLDAG